LQVSTVAEKHEIRWWKATGLPRVSFSQGYQYSLWSAPRRVSTSSA
jgi:hypothetical protein